MGNDNSNYEREREERERKDIEEFRKSIDKGPDLKIDKSIVMFSSLTSTDSLKQHYEKRRMETGDCAADWIKGLAEKFGACAPEPELAGLGALAVAVLIDILSFSPPEESIKEALRAVFAEEKASEVWDLIDECLKRCRMHIDRRKELKSDLKRIEAQLSVALTKLRNSMVRGGHVTNQAIKIWVNGAALHIQMLIHLERLGGTQNCDPIKRLIKDYSEDLDAVFRKHEEMIRKKCSWYEDEDTSAFSGMTYYGDLHLVDEESVYHRTGGAGSSDQYLEAYYDERYSKQKNEIKNNFSDVEENLPELIRQKGSLDIPRYRDDFWKVQCVLC